MTRDSISRSRLRSWEGAKELAPLLVCIAIASLGAGLGAAKGSTPVFAEQKTASAPPPESRAAADRTEYLLRSLSQRETLLEKRLLEEEHRLAAEKEHEDEKPHAVAAGTTVSAGRVNPAPQPESTAARALRQQLQDTRQRLADLEIVDTDLHPDVIAAKEQIKALQQQLQDASPATAVSASGDRDQPVAKDAGAEQIHATIFAEKRQIADDHRDLGTVRVAMKALEATHRASGRFPADSSLLPMPASRALPPVAEGVSKPTKLLMSLPSRPEPVSSIATVAPAARQRPSIVEPSNIPPRSASISARALLGCVLSFFFLSGIFVALRKGRDKSIRDSATLRGMLPKDIDYLGSIPRMRAE